MTQFVLPESSLLSEESRNALCLVRDLEKEMLAEFKTCLLLQGADGADTSSIRKRHAEAVYKTSAYRRVRDRYAVAIAVENMGGVDVEIFTPAEGVAAKNRNRVLINLHGGAFQVGSRTISHLESIPIASVGRIKVVSVDYRMAPEYRFPAATEDVVAVYRMLLRDYAPEDIGIYGCSAGAMLTAQTAALLQAFDLPRPGVISMLCAGASYWAEGDSGHFGAAMTGVPLTSSQEDPYFANTGPTDPFAFPVRCTRVLANFPPSLLIAATRDFALSSVVHTHSRLVEHGVETDLHVWEGLDHAFHYYPDLPQSREVYEVVLEFFDRHLGT